MQPQTGIQVLGPLIVYIAAVLLLAAAMVGVSYLLGQHHREKSTGSPYESGIISTGNVNIRISVRFYMIAMFFVVFDIESVFIFIWALSLKEAGWAGYIEMLVFILIFLSALIYLWREGALEWAKDSRKYSRKN
jgi:NADH-quinone oxidoreductase subunit A